MVYLCRACAPARLYLGVDHVEAVHGHEDRPPVELQFARTGFFTSGYELRLAKDTPLLELEPIFHWATFLTDHAVRFRRQGTGPEQQPLVLALSGFCVRLLRSRARGSAAS